MTRIRSFSMFLLVVISCCSWSRVFSFSLVSTTLARTTTTFSPRKSQHIVNIHQHAAKKSNKGFGGGGDEEDSKKQRTSKTNKQQEEVASSAVTTVTTTTLPSKQQSQSQQQQQQRSLNEGQKALAEMRRQRAETRDAELRKVREMKMADEQVQEAPASIPEKVAQRMGARMLPFVGVPLFLGLGTFVGFWYMATYRDMEFQPALVATSTIVILTTSLVGITYSVMSASWDEDREGDLLGVNEFQKNIGNIKDGLGRSRENAILRDRMANIGQEEMNMALTDLERREKAQQKKRGETLESKLKDELD